MDKKYIELFKNLAQATAVSAEQVMDYNKSQNDEKGFKTAEVMRNDYQELLDKLNSDAEYAMTKVDAARLLIAATVQVNQLETNIDALKKAKVGYETKIIPILKEVLDNSENDEAAASLANTKFILDDNE